MDPEELKVLTETLKEKAAAQYRLRVPFQDIQSERHRHVLDGAIKNALATELAQFTYAQIMDGLPTGDVCFERRFPHVFGEHPIDSCHDELCPGAFDKAQEYYQQWNSDILTFDPMVSHVFDILCRIATHCSRPLRNINMPRLGLELLRHV